MQTDVEPLTPAAQLNVCFHLSARELSLSVSSDSDSRALTANDSHQHFEMDRRLTHEITVLKKETLFKMEA